MRKDQKLNAAKFADACQLAIAQSLKDDARGCTIHVSAIVGRDEEGLPAVIGYRVTDWYDDAVVAHFRDGKRRD